MKESKRNNQSELDPYEDMVRVENLDAYESLIKSNLIRKKKSIK